MSWTCSSATNDELVSAVVRNRLLRSPTAIAAMRRVDRRWFIPSSYSVTDAYRDCPLSIGHGATISAPHMHAIALEVMASCITREDRAFSSSSPSSNYTHVLDIGSGSGYLTAVMAEMCSMLSATNGQTWKVIGIEHVKELQERSLCAIKKYFPSWLEKGNVEIICGDGRIPEKTLSGGAAANQPLAFDVIHVGAAIPTAPPSLIGLLKLDACLVAPVGVENETQRLMVIRKDNQGKVTQETNCLVSYIPLTSIDKQLKGH